jgi:hypothetical protein
VNKSLGWLAKYIEITVLTYYQVGIIEKKKEDIEAHTPTTVGACLRIIPICYLLYVGFVGSGMHSLRAHILSRSLRKEFEKSCVRGTHFSTPGFILLKHAWR